MRNKPPRRLTSQTPQPESTTEPRWQAAPRRWLHQLNQYRITTVRVTKESIDWFANFLFDTTVTGGRIRRWLFIFMAALLWGVTARVSNPLPPDWDFFIYPINALFDAKTLRHVLVAALAFWLALKTAAIYLDDVFELEDPKIAERYILQASLANRFPKIEIKDGRVENDEEEEEDSTIVRIGGPGLVRVHYDSAALFEKFNGDPTVIIAEDEQVALDRFERLRKVVRLRDHIDETSISTRTRDGITVRADGIRVKYHLLRYAELPTAEQVPFPVVREAVEKQVYGERVSQRLNPLALNSKPDTKAPEKKERHPETLNLTPGPITSELTKFISSTTLSEFLAAISEPEVNQLFEDSQQLDRDAISMSGAMQVSELDEEPPKPPVRGGPDFKPRSDITRQIYENYRKNTRLPSGIELSWIDIGTWVLPPNAEQIVKQHEEAWRKSLENLKQRSDGALAGSERESMIKTTRTLLREIIYEFRKMEGTAPAPEVIHALLHQYMAKLGMALEIYQKRAESRSKSTAITRISHIHLADESEDDDSGTPLQINKTFSYLSKLLNLYKSPDKP